ncbi:MAG: hypothetical protein BGP25_13330 [Lysobacterales bacterium 63-13]|nr:MAG: hypothetical protein BGP25_13330 [Xanthomonadales bacterium 63-13]
MNLINNMLLTPIALMHPLLQLFRPIVATNAIERLADAVNAAIDAGYRGLSVFGFARFGKTQAITYLMDHLGWLGNRAAALLRVDASEARKRTDRTFYQSLLATLGVRIPSRAQTDELCALVMARLIEACQSAPVATHLVILFIDEAQRLLPTDYENLVSLDNRMTQAGYYLFVVFIQQRDMTGFTNEVIAGSDHPPHITGRFLIRKHEFTGLQNVSELAYALSRYDESTEWPPGSNVSYVMHFAPGATANGFKLAHYAEPLWREASNLRAEERLPEHWTWPMKSFESTVVHLLTTVIPQTPSFEQFSNDELKEAIHNSGLIELEQSRHTYKPQEVK